ncbi:DNA primase [Orrella daihaiensis]|uniref:DNA primase n=1 Tax=Orrella daihaiensis TaxID=2782176 RepID=A0ABY4ALX2_9BURK|nr:DNA primase [Orrella daihaiensis]UOD51267.1 DNA primase [Orrella daihaiensis]
MIPDSFIQELLARVDVVDVVGRYVQLRKGGANLLGLCPFHQEKSPSFTVSPSKQFFHCFGCGAHGSAIGFLMQHSGASFQEAVRTLASTVGMQVPESNTSPATRARAAQRRQEQNAHSAVLDKAQDFYKAQLKDHPPAVQYLKSRGLTGQIAARYGLGWAPESRQGLATVFGRYEDPLLVEAGLVIESDDGRRYDRFRGRVMFPIRNMKGELIGFGGRIIDKGEPKYLNSPETPVFSKGQELYGAWEGRQAIRTEDQVIVVEGYMDVVGLAQLGVENAVATLGTATTADHLRKLIRLTHRIVFSFDGDSAGRRAAWRALQTALPLLRDDLSVRFLFLPAGHDPDTYIREFGQAAFKACIKDAVALSSFLLDELSERHRLDEPEGRSACVHEAVPILAQIPDGALKHQVLNEFASRVRLTREELDGLMASDLRLAQRQSSAASATPTWSADQPTARSLPASERASPHRGPDIESSEARAGEAAVPPWELRSASRSDRRRAVAPLAKRLLSLLLAHPELAEQLGEQQLEVLEGNDNLILVKEFVLLVQATGARHLGALLEAADPDSDLAQVLTGLSGELMAQMDLPAPEAEWEDALARIELDSLKREQASLVTQGLGDQASIERYQELAKRIQGLTSVSKGN